MSGNSDTIPLNVDIVNRRRTRAHGVKQRLPAGEEWPTGLRREEGEDFCGRVEMMVSCPCWLKNGGCCVGEI